MVNAVLFRLCIKYLEEGTGKVLACGVCRLPLAAKQEVFTVPGAEGVTGAYVNPHGYVCKVTLLSSFTQRTQYCVACNWNAYFMFCTLYVFLVM